MRLNAIADGKENAVRFGRAAESAVKRDSDGRDNSRISFQDKA